MTRNKKIFELFKSFSFVLFFRGLAAVGGVLYPIVIARTQGSESLGNFSVSYTVLLGVVVLLRRGVDTSFLTYLPASTKYRQVKVLFSSIKSPLFFSFSVSFISFLLLYIFWEGRHELFLSSITMLVASPFIVGIVFLNSFYKATNRPVISCFMEFGFVMMLSALTYSVARLLFRFDSFFLLPEICFLSSSVVIFLSITTPRYALLLLRVDSRNGRNLAYSKSSAFFLGSNALNFLGQFSLTVVPAMFFGATVVGEFKEYERYATVLSFPLMAINSIVGFFISKEHVSKRKLSFTLLAASAAGFTSSLLLVVPLLYFLTKDNIFFTYAFSFLLMANVVNSTIGYSGLALNAMGLYEKQFFINLSIGLLSLIAVFPMVKWLGADGLLFLSGAILLSLAIFPLLFIFKRSYG